MNIISVWNPKGGQGKSLIAINLAAAAYQLDLRPIIICDDPQGTATMFYNHGNLPFPVIQKMPSEKPECDLLVIDHKAADWNPPPAKTIIIPTKPDRSQFATYQDALMRITGKGKNIIPVVTDGNMQRATQMRAVKAMRQLGAYEIKSSGVFGRADEEFRTIFDPELNNAYKVNERRAEFHALLAGVLRSETKIDTFRVKY